MTKIETLELGVENLKTQIQELDEKEWEIRERKDEELTNAFSLFFQNDLDKNITIEYSRGSIYFKMKEDDREYLKEIFTIYLKEGSILKSISLNSPTVRPLKLMPVAPE